MTDPKYAVFTALDPFISVVTIEDRKIVQWRDYMDSLAAMTALSMETAE